MITKIAGIYEYIYYGSLELCTTGNRLLLFQTSTAWIERVTGDYTYLEIALNEKYRRK